MPSGKLKWALEISGVDKAAQQLRDLDKLASSPLGAKGVRGADFGGASSSFLRLNPGLASLLTPTPSAIPPKIAPPFLTRPPMTGQNILAGILGMGAGNNYLSARAFLAAGGIGGGGGMGMFGGMGAGGAGGAKSFLPAAAALAAVKLAAEGLKFAFENLKESVQRGSKLFQDAARVGRPVGTTFQLQSALRAIGMDENTANMLLLLGQFSRSGRSGGNFMRPGIQNAPNTTTIGFEGVLLGARNRAAQQGELQQLVNLSNYARDAWRDAAVDARIAAGTAGNLFQVTFNESKLKREWNTLWEQFGAILSNALLPAVRIITMELKGVNEVVENMRKGLGISLMALTGGRFGSGFMPQGGGGQFQPALAGQSLGSTVNQFQRMGFIMRGGPTEQLVTLREISRNTGLSAAATVAMVKYLNAHNPIEAVGTLRNNNP